MRNTSGKTQIRFVNVISLLLLASLAGCGPKYVAGFYNATNGLLTDVEYLDSPGMGKAGDLSPYLTAQFSRKHSRIPDFGVMTWRTPNGVVHCVTVPIRSGVPNPGSFDGDIWFVITDSGIEVRPWSRDRMFAEGRSYPWGEKWSLKRAQKIQEQAPLGICIRNNGTSTITNTVLTWATLKVVVPRRLAVMTMRPGEQSITMELTEVPEFFDISWISEDEEIHHAKVAIPQHSDKRKRTDLAMSIGSDNKATLCPASAP
jgi:hypothetical protein